MKSNIRSSASRHAHLKFLAQVLVALSVSACSTTGRPEAGAIGGGALGAGVGGVIGNQSGNAGPGAAIGAGVGAVSGAVVGDAIDEEERRNAERDALLIRQEQELKRQQRELEDLRRQRYHDNKLKKYLRQHGAESEPEVNYRDEDREYQRENRDEENPERLY
jgi:hypothetical protein